MKKKSSSPSGFLSLRDIAILFCATAACSVLTVPLLAFLRPQEQVNGSLRTLSFEERVSYQKAIEEVYWRHRIWPKERTDPKPSLDAVMSQAQLEKKVTDYLRNSQALEDYWQRPITDEQLQAEMDRMAKHSKQPEVLQELFEALSNDPFIIAECLARPALAERLVTNWYTYDQRIHGELKQRAETELQARPSIGQMKHFSGKYSEVEFVKSDRGQDEHKHSIDQAMRLNVSEWDQTVRDLATMFGDGYPVAQAGTPAHIKTGVMSLLQEGDDRYYATAVVTKTKDRLKLATVTWLKEPFETWRARAADNMPKSAEVSTGNYRLPVTLNGTEACTNDTWTATAGLPDSRSNHSAVWTGSEMIIWGGYKIVDFLNTGGRYNPTTDSWTTVTLTDAPTPRAWHTAVWTGSEMIVWGGSGGSSGGRYSPGTDTWVATNTTNAPTARSGHTAIWTGTEMIIWGGNDGNWVNTGSRYNPSLDSWVATTTISAPTGRSSHSAVWTGSEMIIWAGDSGGANVNTGGKYDPETDSWTATSTTNVPDARAGHTAVWTGTEMIIWGGRDIFAFFDTGARFNPDTNSWTATSTTNAPDARESHTAVWTGTEMIIWGGIGNLNTGGTYNPQTDSWTATSLTNAPTGRLGHTAVWTDGEMIIWGGSDDQLLSVFSTGGRYDPTTNTWIPTGTDNTPDGRYRHSGVWTGSELIVWGGRNRNLGFLNSGAKYAPVTDAWTPMTMANAPLGRAYHATVWTGSEMIVWGGFANTGYFNSGGKYNPGTDSWLAISTTNAPVGRELPTGVWSGSEMIVWGGYYYDGNDHYVNTGGRYNPDTDSWTTTNTTNAPVGRESHTAVWTGSRMVVWGGFYADPFTHELNTGGKYDPNTDSWAPTSTINVPAGRDSHRAVWTGSEMIIWGGLDDVIGYSNTGGRYNPNTNSWIATSPTNAPSGRVGHSIIWTGDTMIVWGGLFYDTDYRFLNTGGRYDPNSNSWTATSTINAPSPRDLQAAVWTGNEMIVWGGLLFANVGSGTGGRYCVQSAPTPTPTPCTGRCGPTPRPRPTPHTRPSPR